jgi:hypothetical protein
MLRAARLGNRHCAARTVSAFSILWELTFLVDGWTWSVGGLHKGDGARNRQVRIGQSCGGYRQFVHGLVAILHLPHLPQLVYDAGGIVFNRPRRLGR